MMREADEGAAHEDLVDERVDHAAELARGVPPAGDVAVDNIRQVPR